MPQAMYQPTNIGHFGLALTHYAHFTSPIRRYPDLVVHRTLKALIGARRSPLALRAPRLAHLGESTSRLEKRADEADRYVSGFLKCTYLKERIGQTFQGLITTVVEFGCFVQILDVGVDGLLHIDNLRDDAMSWKRTGTGGADAQRPALANRGPHPRRGHGREPHRGADRPFAGRRRARARLPCRLRRSVSRASTVCMPCA